MHMESKNIKDKTFKVLEKIFSKYFYKEDVF